MPGDMPKGLRIQAVEADVDPSHPRGEQRLRVLCQPIAVGRHGKFVEPVAEPFTDPRGEICDAAPHQRFATRQPDLAHAAIDEAIRDQRDFLKTEQMIARQEAHMLRHAIAASQIAAIGDRDSQIGDRAAILIDQGARACHTLELGACPCSNKSVCGFAAAG